MISIWQRRLSRRRVLAAGAGLAAVLALGASKCATISTVALRNGRVFTGTGEPILERGTVACYGGIIIAVGADDEVALGRDTRIIDCAGAFVMPGVIDTHVHVTETLIRREPLLGGWLRGGVTTIRDTGTIWQGPALLRSLTHELGPAPRIIATGGIMTVPDGYPTSRGPTGVAGSMIVQGVDGAADAVKYTLDAGAEFIKIAVETGRPGGHLLEDAGEPTLSLDQVRAITTAAHSRGAPVAAHVTNEWELRRALDGGVDSIAHTPNDPIPNDLLRRIVDGRVPMASTSNIWDGAAVTKNVQANIKRVADAGGVVAMGTDYPFQAHTGLPIAELLLMEDAGLTREQVLLAATRDAAIMCGRGDIGVLQAGRIADILVVDGDPLQDLSALLDVRHVLQSGEPVT